MSKIEWDVEGKRTLEAGVDQGVLYLASAPAAAGTEANPDSDYETGVAWDGLTSVNESPDGGDVTDFWADNMIYASVRAAERFKATIEAMSYPDEFDACNGFAEVVPGMKVGQQSRRKFGLTYRSKVGSDLDTDLSAYRIHVVYGCSVSPSERNYETVNETPNFMTMSWEMSSTPVKVEGFKPTAYFEFDSRKLTDKQLKALEDKLYGTDATQPQLPTPAKLIALIEGAKN